MTAPRGIDREGRYPQRRLPRRRQPRSTRTAADLRHVSRRSARNKEQRSRGRTAEKVVLGVPARHACAFADEVRAMAVEGCGKCSRKTDPTGDSRAKKRIGRRSIPLYPVHEDDCGRLLPGTQNAFGSVRRRSRHGRQRSPYFRGVMNSAIAVTPESANWRC